MVQEAITKTTYYAKQITAPNNGVQNPETITINIPANQEGYTELSITNPTQSLLPVTGGAGTLIFVICGLFIIGGALVYYKFNKSLKKNAEV